MNKLDILICAAVSMLLLSLIPMLILSVRF